MRHFIASSLMTAALALGGCGGPTSRSELPAVQAGAGGADSPAAVESRNASGTARTIRAGGGPVKDAGNPFFKAIGTNGRSCSTCHVAEENMSVTPAGIQARFDASDGTDPIFRLIDGATRPDADASTVEARRAAYAMLLSKGVFRVGIGIPADAEFELAGVDRGYGFESAAQLSLFRRPLPSSNLTFLSTVMWDGRETFKATTPTGFAPLAFDLADQASSATVMHAEGAALGDGDKQAIVDYETQLFTAQAEDGLAGALDVDGATGGLGALSQQPFSFGVNDPLGAVPGAIFDPAVMTAYAAWRGSADEHRAAIARGEDLFNTRKFTIQGVAGLNDSAPDRVVIKTGTCSLCHDTPNAGSHSVPAPLRLGTDAPDPVGGLDTSGLPVYTLRHKGTAETQVTTDPGRALITGKWQDVGKFKGPTLRGLAGRAPYFHNGSARDLSAVVNFYDKRFDIGLTDEEKADLAAFLGAL